MNVHNGSHLQKSGRRFSRQLEIRAQIPQGANRILWMAHVFNFCPSQALSEEIKGNVVCSALSVQLALAMLHTGAKGETAKKLKKALCLPTDLEATNHGFKELVTKLQVCRLIINIGSFE